MPLRNGLGAYFWCSWSVVDVFTATLFLFGMFFPTLPGGWVLVLDCACFTFSSSPSPPLPLVLPPPHSPPHKDTNLSSHSDAQYKVPLGNLGISIPRRSTNLSSDDALATVWRRSGDALTTLWRRSGDALTMLWRCVGDAEAMRWRRCGDALATL